MKPSEFYTKYWKVTMPDGTIVSPPPLSEKELFYMDEVVNDERLRGIYFGRKRKRNVIVDIEQMKEAMKLLPEFLKDNK